MDCEVQECAASVASAVGALQKRLMVRKLLMYNTCKI